MPEFNFNSSDVTVWLMVETLEKQAKEFRRQARGEHNCLPIVASWLLERAKDFDKIRERLIAQSGYCS